MLQRLDRVLHIRRLTRQPVGDGVEDKRLERRASGVVLAGGHQLLVAELEGARAGDDALRAAHDLLEHDLRCVARRIVDLCSKGDTQIKWDTRQERDHASAHKKGSCMHVRACVSTGAAAAWRGAPQPSDCETSETSTRLVSPVTYDSTVSPSLGTE